MLWTVRHRLVPVAGASGTGSIATTVNLLPNGTATFSLTATSCVQRNRHIVEHGNRDGSGWCD